MASGTRALSLRQRSRSEVEMGAQGLDVVTLALELMLGFASRSCGAQLNWRTMQKTAQRQNQGQQTE